MYRPMNSNLLAREELDKSMRNAGSIENFMQNLPRGITLVDGSCCPGNCEAFALNNDGDLGLRAYGFLETIAEGQEAKGDIVLYYSRCGDIMHMGVYQGQDTVVSKWGPGGPVLQHPIELVPLDFGKVIDIRRRKQNSD